MPTAGGRERLDVTTDEATVVAAAQSQDPWWRLQAAYHARLPESCRRALHDDPDPRVATAARNASRCLVDELEMAYDLIVRLSTRARRGRSAQG